MRLPSALLCLFASAILSAQRPYLFRDVGTSGTSPVNPGSEFTPLGTTPGNPAVFWFRASTPGAGDELWRMQGNNQALPVGDHVPGPEGSFPELIDAGPPAVFAMHHPDTGCELWRMNAQGQLEPLPEAVPGRLGAFYSERVVMNGATYVMRTTETKSAELLKIAAGQVTAVAGIPGHAEFASLTVDESSLLHIFVKQEPLPDRHFVSDCTGPGTLPLPESFRDVVTGPRGDYFAADAGNGAGQELYRFGQTASTLVLNIHPTGSSSPREFVRIGNLSYFTADDGASGRELWQTDGTTAGTTLFADIRPGPLGSDPLGLVASQGRLYFSADDGVTGRELRFLDVVTRVVSIVKDIRSGNLGSGIDALLWLGTELFFAADDGMSGRELWRSDGTAVGTVLVRDIHPGAAGSNPGPLFVSGGTVLFGAYDGVHDFEPWRSDGTAAGTVFLQDLSPPVARTAASNPYGFFDAGWDTIFGATEAGGTELYRMTFNGAMPAAGRIKDINPAGSSDPREFVSLPDGRVLFSANHVSRGREIWVTDGTDAGTVLVKDIRPGSSGAEPAGLLWVPGLRAVLFSADDGVSGREPWISDGTAAGTQRFADILPGSAGSEASHFALRRDGTLFFRADDGRVGVEPWVLDHGSNQPRLLADLLNIGLGSMPRSFTFVDDGSGREKVFFAADAALGRHALYVSDGTTAGTSLVRTFRTIQVSSRMVGFVDARLYFAADDGTSGIELWKSDGTLSGTAMVADLAPGPNGSIPQELTPLLEPFMAGTSKLFFAAGTTLGQELCVIGPHPVHSLRILDVNPWAGSGNPRDLAVERGPTPRLVFAADGGDGRGHEPWVTLGAQESTRRVADINKLQGAGSDPRELTPTSYGWLLSADDGIHGREVWRLDPLRGVVLDRGPACGPAQATLEATPPRIGRPMTISGDRMPASSLMVLTLNVPITGRSQQILGCAFTFDPLTGPQVPIVPQGPRWTLTAQVPDAPWLVEAQLDTKGVVLRPPLEVEFTRGLGLTIGN
jgi:ELWxxDGT repeat protein